MPVFEFDATTTFFLNQFVNYSLFFDKAIISLAGNYLLKCGVIMALLWWCWTRPDGKIHVDAIKVIFGALLAISLGRGFQNYLPFRPRPFHNPDLGFVVPYSHVWDPSALEEWSSFPSDHAVLVFALSTGIWSYSRRLGVFAFVWSATVVCGPRVYLGLHYLSDVLAGAAVGIVIMASVLAIIIFPQMSYILENLQQRHVKVFYSAMFLVTFEITTMFEGVRSLLRGLRMAIG
jgi:undecaprenyl-diphosphatase